VKRFNALFIVALMAGFLLVLCLNAPAAVARAQAPQPPDPADPGGAYGADGGTGIQATTRISIPFGFQTPLPALHAGRDVLASGHGGCTADELVTVVVTVTQSSSGAVATGEHQWTCTGELQTWSLLVAANTSASFSSAAGQACGLATTRSGGYVTDSFDWCKDVDLLRLDQQLYLPVTLAQ
jgi:hypothetical protein